MPFSEKSINILIVDDEDLFREACRHALKVLGYKVATAHDGFSGMAKAKEIAPDMVLVDLEMPGMSGIEVLEKLDEICPWAIKTLITGYVSANLEKEVTDKLGGWGFLAKPFTPDELRKHVQEALNSKHAFRE